ncbi:polysaccharide deacetylase family protein [Marinoscillum sp.]|uniref:polysaccharide deacetylase family protein n=1 Tax=Marinoscillum sp. TaxID=2024838 RepID=UPI003BA9A933
MRTYFFKNPWWLSRFYHKAIFTIPDDNGIYLTFDDGPHPEVTPWVLDQLKQFHAKATFFTIGKMVENHGDVLAETLKQGHAVGGHTYRHNSGWQLTNADYMEEVTKGMQLLPQTKLFRPPYGHIRLTQLNQLGKSGIQTVMWSHLAGDWDRHLMIDESLNSLKAAKPGSIIVFHDSAKAFQNLKILLPQVLEHFSTLQYSFKSISQS